MECKGDNYVTYLISDMGIGIYPEWNVKIDNFKYGALKLEIGIYPEWNVKNFISGSLRADLPLEYIQNGM